MQDAEVDSYRRQFASAEESSSYDLKEYHPSSYSSVLWEVERGQLVEAAGRWLPNDLTEARYLDFACGTGRVLSFMENHTGSALGIEISEQMARFARQKVSRAEVRCLDITSDPRSTEFRGRFDVITAFRFILNAESSLRDEVFGELAKMLASDESVIIFNNHGNLFSHKALLWPYHRLKMGRKYHTSGNYLSHGEVVSLAARHGLSVVQRAGCGVLSAKALKLLPLGWVVAAERWLARTPLHRLGVNQMYVVRRKAA